MKEYQWKHSC